MHPDPLPYPRWLECLAGTLQRFWAEVCNSGSSWEWHAGLQISQFFFQGFHERFAMIFVGESCRSQRFTRTWLKSSFWGEALCNPMVKSHEITWKVLRSLPLWNLWEVEVVSALVQQFETMRMAGKIAAAVASWENHQEWDDHRIS